MIKLKDGSMVDDVRFSRLIEFDERSRDFPILALNKNKKQRSYTWRCTTVLDQGREGSCVGHGVGHELIARPSESRNIDHNFCTKLYHDAQRIDPWRGGAYEGAVPFYEGTSVLAGIKIGQRLGYYESYRWAFGLDDLIMGVGHNGPAVLGLRWYADMSFVNSDGYISPTGRLNGGHCLLCHKVDVKKERFTLWNSWGINWGMKGTCYVSFADMDFLLKQRGEAVFCLDRHTVPQPKLKTVLV